MGKKHKDKTKQRKHKKEKDKKRRNGKSQFRLLSEQAQLYGCWINQDWNSSGIAYIIIARKMVNGLLMYATFLLDSVNQTVKHCNAYVNCSCEKFDREIVSPKDGLEFFNAELELVKELLGKVSSKAREHESDLPGEYQQCLKLVGHLDEYMESKEKPPAQEEHSGPCLVYRTSDPEIVEAELHQLPSVEECADSSPRQKKFVWFEIEKKSIIPGKKENIATLILENGNLVVEFYDKRHKKLLHNNLLQYLGTSISILKEEEE